MRRGLRGIVGWAAVGVLAVVGLAAHVALRSVLGTALPAVLLPAVGAAAWLGGARAGFVAGAAMVLLRLGVWWGLGLEPWTDLFTVPVLVGVAALALVGGAGGWLRELSVAAHRAEAELEALLDAIDETVIRYGADGSVRWINRRGRQRFLEHWGRLPTTTAETRAMVGPDAPPHGQAALNGEVSTGVFGFTDGAGELRRFSVRAVPIREAGGRVTGAVVVWHDVTEQHQAIEALGRYDGATKTVRRVLHEMGNALAPARGYSELLGHAAPEQAEMFVAEIRDSVARAASVLDQFGAVVRFAEVEFGGEVMLDLEAAAVPDGAANGEGQSPG